jgi:anti-anti-sigma factor
MDKQLMACRPQNDGMIDQALNALSDSHEDVRVAASALTITRQHRGDHFLFRLEGELDATSSTIARGVFAPVLYGTDAERVILDLRKLEYLDSTGLGIIASLYRTTLADEGGRSVALLVLPDSTAERILHLCGFDRAFTILASLEGEMPKTRVQF